MRRVVERSSDVLMNFEWVKLHGESLDISLFMTDFMGGRIRTFVQALLWPIKIDRRLIKKDGFEPRIQENFENGRKRIFQGHKFAYNEELG